MEKLNSYLQQLLNTCGLELRLEPNKNPYIMTVTGKVDAANSPLPGTQINSMIFALIPNDIKQQLPNQAEVEFVHPHNLGHFGFSVRKSPSGFNVTITPNAEPTPVADSQEPEPLIETAQSAIEAQELQSDSPRIEDSDRTVEASNTALDESLSAGPAEMAPEFTVEDLNSDNGMAPDDDSDLAPDEFPGSENAYQSTYDSSTIDIEVESADSSYQVDFSDFEDSNNSDSPQEAVPTNFTSNTAPQFETQAYTEAVEIEQEPAADLNEPMNQTTPIVPTAPHAVAAANNTFTPANPKDRAAMDDLFAKMAAAGASDLHLSVSMPPLARKDGKMQELVPGAAKLTPQSMEVLVSSIMPEKNRQEFESRNDTDFAYEIAGLARFRANVFRDRKGMGGVFRIIPSEIMTAEDLELSKSIMDLTKLSKGLVVVTGPTGSGKSTTLCAMVDSINKTREEHIITIEDPIEFTHENLRCLVNQREVHNHTRSFKDALRAALREDPDILLVGEMRDLETISIAIETAETGHLVFGTLHTTTAPSTVDRIIDQFPADRQQQIRVMLSESLKGVIAQTLLPKIGGGRIAALEVLIVTPAIANLIREGKTFQIPSQMQTGKNLGMRMLNDSLIELVNKGLVEPKDAYLKAVDKDGFEMLLERNGKKL